MATREQEVTAAAQSLGLPFVGCTRLGPVTHAPFVEAWLAEGRAGEMSYLVARAAERLDPRRAFPWARALIAVAWPYDPPPPPPGDWRATLRGRIAAYALGPDYHRRFLQGLERLARRLGERFPGARFLAYTDTGPIIEREWAMRAGIGWIGRNTLVLGRASGSYLLLGELLTDLELEAPPLPDDHCGGCTRCLQACPTAAFDPGGYAMDPRRCLAYLTIEHRGAIPLPMRPALGNWIFGCDVCQEVCPWNRAARAAPESDFLAPHLPSLLALDETAFRARYGGSAVKRARRPGLLRNAAVALGNSGNPDAVQPLAAALDDVESLVRAHAAWALGRLGGALARRALDRARRRETDARTAGEITAALAAAAA